jgi:hypothetical protein
VINWGILGTTSYELGIFDSLRPIIAHPHDPKLWATSGSHSDPGGNLLFDGVTWVLSAFFYGGLFRMSNRQVRGEAIGIGDVFSGGSTFLPMLGYVIIFGLISTLGSCCFCVGALPVYALLFPGFALIADGAGFSEAFTRAFEGMKQDWLRASLYVFVFGLIILVSFIPLGLGLLITTPMIYLSTSLAYRDMIGMPGPPGGNSGLNSTQGPPGAWPPAPNSLDPTPSSGSYGQTPPDQAPPPPGSGPAS